MKPKFWWIKERHNPQFKQVYYVACGQITRKAAKHMENTIYGYNSMFSFETEQEYRAKIEELKAQGYEVERG